MRALAAAFALLAAPLLAAPASANPYEGLCSPKPWGLTGEQPICFAGRVVDVLCELSGDCPADCGGGTRQIGLVSEPDGRLMIAGKNGQPVFSGAVHDLAPYCQQRVLVEGQSVGGEDVAPGAPRMLMIQRVRPIGGDWAKANRFTKAWAEKHPDAGGKGPWFRRDPLIGAEIEADGYLGLGPEADRAFIKDWY